MSFWNGPNALTLLRIAAVPVFGALLLGGSNRWLVLAVFLLAALTDLVDGWWARRSGIITDFGKLWDPIADKALTGTAWLLLSWLGELPWLATALILVRELGITIWRLRFADRMDVAADRGGKWKTTFQMFTISFWLVGYGFSVATDWLLYGLLWSTVAFTTYTGLRYVSALAGRSAS